jgi:hypothetical protein
VLGPVVAAALLALTIENVARKRLLELRFNPAMLLELTNDGAATDRLPVLPCKPGAFLLFVSGDFSLELTRDDTAMKRLLAVP